MNQGIDSIKDFQSRIDKIIISALGFGGGLQVGIAITADRFLETTNSTATMPDQRLIYDLTTGGLFFDWEVPISTSLVVISLIYQFSQKLFNASLARPE